LSFQIDARQFFEFAEQLGVADDKLDAAFLEAGNKGAQEGANIARGILAANGSVVTGELAGSIKGFPTTRSGDVYNIKYGPDEEYPGTWVEHGRGPVSAGPGRKLRFQIKGAGPYIFRKSVGPAAPRPFMKPSIARVRPIVAKLFGDAMNRVIGGML
jgi:hypothetical protein